MRIVVTGASGNVGTALLRRIAAGGVPAAGAVSVLGVCRRPPRDAGPPYATASWLACDLGAAGATATLARAFAGADAVVHLAWAIQPGRDDPPMRRTNVEGSEHVLAAAVAAGVPHLVMASSVAAYGPAADPAQRVREDWPTRGVRGSAYSLQKAALERRLDRLEADRPGLAVARIRPVGIAQPDAASQLARFTAGSLAPARLAGRVPLPVLAPPRTRFQLVHSADVAAALVEILARRAVGAFNLAAEPVLTGHDLAAELRGPWLKVPLPLLAALAWPTWLLGLHAAHPSWLKVMARVPLVDTSRARRELGWSPAHPATETLAAVFAAVRAGRGTPSPPLRPTGGLRVPRRFPPLPPRTQSQYSRQEIHLAGTGSHRRRGQT